MTGSVDEDNLLAMGKLKVSRKGGEKEKAVRLEAAALTQGTPSGSGKRLQDIN